MIATAVRDTLADLARHSGPFSVSIHLPTHRRYPETEQDPIRLKNSIDAAAAALEALGADRCCRASVLAGPMERLDDPSFWQHRDRGLALFCAPEAGTVEVSVPAELPERVVVGDRFHIRPLLAVHDAIRLPALVVTRHGARFYEIEHEVARPVEVDLPASVEDANWFMDREAQLQRRPQRPGAHGGVHGHDPSQLAEADLRRYLDAIAQAIRAPLRTADQPLLVFGTDHLIADLSGLLDHTVIPAPSLDPATSPDKIVEIAVPTIEALRTRRRDDAAERAREAIGRRRGITEIEAALHAATEGRIDELLIDVATEPMWGRHDPDRRSVELMLEHAPGSVDLLDRVVANVLLTSGRISLLGGPVDSHALVAIPRF